VSENRHFLSLNLDQFFHAGQLREAEVREETIADILWHTRPGMTAHYSVAQAAELVEALNRITDERQRTNRSLAMIAREASRGGKFPQSPYANEKRLGEDHLTV